MYSNSQVVHPTMVEEPPENLKLNTRNVFSVLVNKDNQLLVRGESMDPAVLKERAKEFIMNPQQRDDLSVSPKKAIISLKNDRGTEYETYITVYNELKAAYNEIWNEISNERFGKEYPDLDIKLKREIRKDVPFVISEAEPTAFGEG